MPVIIENNTKFPLTVYAVKDPPKPGAIPPEKWRCIIGNVDDRGRAMQVFTAEGIPVPGKTEPIPDSKPMPAEQWRGRLPSPIAVFSTEEWNELQKSPCWPALEALIKAGDFTQRRSA